MKNIFPILTALIISVSSGVAQDRIFLKNGDILSGKVLQQNEQHVYLKSSAFGAVALSIRDVAEIRLSVDDAPPSSVPAAAVTQALNLSPEADAGKAIITTVPNTENKPADAPVEKPGSAIKAEPSPGQPAAKPFEKPTAATIADLVSKPKPGPPKQDRWSGQTGLAIALREKTSSNQNGTYRDDKYETYRFYGNVNWKGDRNDFRWDWTYRYSRDEYRKRDDFFNIVQKYKHTFKNDSLYASAKTVYQRDYNRRIENEYLQTAEMGVKWFHKDSKIQLSTSAGGGYHMYERLDSNRTESTSVNQPKFIFDQSFRWQLVNSLTLMQKYTHLGDLDDYHLLFSAGLENKLVHDLFLRLEYRLDRDTEVLYDDRGYYDKALLTSLLYKF